MIDCLPLRSVKNVERANNRLSDVRRFQGVPPLGPEMGLVFIGCAPFHFERCTMSFQASPSAAFFRIGRDSPFQPVSASHDLNDRSDGFNCLSLA